MRRFTAPVLFLALLVSQALPQCSKDTDCKGDRVCVDGSCVDPAGLSATPAPAAVQAAPPPVSVSGLAKSGWSLGAGVGTWMGGTVNVKGVEVEKDASMLLKVYLDGYLIPQLAFGLFYFNVPGMSTPDMDEDGASSYEIGLAIRPRFLIGPKTGFVPSLEIGYRNTSFDYFIQPADAMALNGDFEIQHVISNNALLFGSFGFLAQPVGGGDGYSYAFAPIFFLMVGFGFGSF